MKVNKLLNSVCLTPAVLYKQLWIGAYTPVHVWVQVQVGVALVQVWAWYIHGGGGGASGRYVMELDVDISICLSIWNKFHGPAAPHFSVHFLFQTSFSENIIHFHQPPYCSGQKWLRHTINCCFHLCPLAYLLLLLRRSMLLWTCCGNSFILQFLRRCGAAPWG